MSRKWGVNPGYKTKITTVGIRYAETPHHPVNSHLAGMALQLHKGFTYLTLPVARTLKMYSH